MRHLDHHVKILIQCSGALLAFSGFRGLLSPVRLHRESWILGAPSTVSCTQKKRSMPGRPQCPYSKHTCPNGVHACMHCERSGHGGEDCRLWKSINVIIQAAGPPPISKARPPAPLLPATSKAKSKTSAPVPKHLQITSQAVCVPGFGCKGEDQKG